MNYHEVERIRKDPIAIQVVVRKILRNLDDRLTPWEKSFLEPLEKHSGPAPLSLRQGEKLVALDNKASRSRTCKGFAAWELVQQLFYARIDLDEGHEEFLNKKYEQGKNLAQSHNLTLSKNEWRYVFLLCRQLNIIEKYIDID